VNCRLALSALALVLPSCSPRPEPPQLQGEWKAISVYKGLALPTTDAESRATVTITETQLVMKFDGKTETSDITVDAATRPPSIDCSPHGASRVYKGIWKIEGDTLTICVGLKEQRPTDFAPGEDRSVMVLQRVKK
jgi:uncharacterized protein (TIGR03067 family)